MYTQSPIELIKNRRSIRNYSSKKIDKDTINNLINILNELSNDKITFGVVELSTNEKFGTYGMISGATHYLYGTIKDEFINDTNTIIDFGFKFEQIILKALDFDLSTCWLAGTFNKNTALKLFNIKDNDTLAIVSPIGYKNHKKRLRDNIVNAVIKPTTRKPSKELFFNKTYDIPLEETSKYKEALEMVRLAPSAKNFQPWRIIKKDNYYNFYTIKSNSKVGTTLNCNLNDIGIAKCHFDLTAKELKLKGSWVILNNQDVYNNLYYVFSWKVES